MNLLPVNLREAQRCYEASAAQGYAPAASLLADLFYYGVGSTKHAPSPLSQAAGSSENVGSASNSAGNSWASGELIERNVALAQQWLQKVLETTSATEADDAYLRVKVGVFVLLLLLLFTGASIAIRQRIRCCCR